MAGRGPVKKGPGAKELQKELEQWKKRALKAEEMACSVQSGNGQVFQTMVETMSEGAVTLSKDGTVLYANRSFSEIIGYSQEQIIGSSFYRFLIHPEIKNQISNIQGKASERRIETTLISGSGRGLPVYIAVSPLQVNGDPGTCLVITDLSQLEAAKRARRVAEELDILFSNISSPLILYDVQGNISKINEAAIHAFGLKPEMSRDRINFLMSAMKFMDEDGKPIAPRDLPSRKALNREKTLNKIIRLLGPDGQERILLESAVPLLIEGVLWGAAIIGHDITEREHLLSEIKRAKEEVEHHARELACILQDRQKLLYDVTGANAEAEARAEELDTIFSSIKDPLLIFSSDGKLEKANDAALEATGLNIDDIISINREKFLSLAKFFYVDHTPIPLDEMPSSRAFRGEVVRGEPMIYVNAKGLERTILTSASPVYIKRKIEKVALVWQDITEREKLLREAEEGRNILQALMEYAPEGIVIAEGPEARIRMISRYATEIPGRSGELVTGGVAERIEKWDVFKADGQTRPAPEELPIVRSASKGETIVNEGWVLGEARTGRKIPILVNTGPIKDRAGRVTGAIGLWRDITEIKKIEGELEQYRKHLEDVVRERTEQLRESEESYRRIFETAQEGIAQVDPEGKILLMNRKMCRILGYEENELIGSSIFDLMDTETATQTKNRMENRKKGLSERYEFRLRRKDGSVRWLYISSSPVFDEKGEFLGSVGMFTDITEKKMAELERLRLIAAIESSADAVCVTDTNGIIEYVNPAYEKITGYSKSEAIGRPADIVRSGKHPEEFYREMWETLRRGEVWKGQFINRRKDGQIYYEDNTISPVRNDRGEIINYVGIKRDVTEKLRMEAIAEAVNVMNNTGFIFSGIRHEIANPINTIKTALSVMRKKAGDNEVMGTYLERSLAEIARLEYLLKALKSFNMYETPEIKDINMESFVKDFLSLIRDQYEKEGIKLNVTREPEAAVVMADPRALQQVLMNLLSNSVDAVRGRRSPRIGISFFKMADKVLIRVEDNGEGLTMEQQKDLFKPFRTTKPEGTGLGLVIVRKMLTKMNGVIEVTSTPNQGTAVDVFLPAGKG